MSETKYTYKQAQLEWKSRIVWSVIGKEGISIDRGFMSTNRQMMHFLLLSIPYTLNQSIANRIYSLFSLIPAQNHNHILGKAKRTITFNFKWNISLVSFTHNIFNETVKNLILTLETEHNLWSNIYFECCSQIRRPGQGRLVLTVASRNLIKLNNDKLYFIISVPHTDTHTHTGDRSSYRTFKTKPKFSLKLPIFLLSPQHLCLGLHILYIHNINSNHMPLSRKINQQ